MADVPVNPASPDPLEAAAAQDPSPVTPAAEPEVAPEPEVASEPGIAAASVEPADVPELAAPAEEPAPASWPDPVTQESSEEDPGAVTALSEAASEPEVARVDDTPTLANPEPVPPPPEAAPSPPPAEPVPAPAPSIAATLEAPPQSSGSSGSAGEEGGEWDLLMGKVRAFLEGDTLQAWWDRLGGPLRGAGLLIALVLVLRLYDALLGTLGDLPLVPRLLQLAGLIALVRFALTKLVRSEDRQAVLDDWKSRWQRFRG